MSYGIVYLYRLSDFLAVAQAHGVSCICVCACWVKVKTEPGAVSPFQWTSVHELGFMGAFGMGYKMQIGSMVTHFANPNDIAGELDNVSLWSKAEKIRRHVYDKLNEERRSPKQKLSVIPGVLAEWEVVRHAVLSWEHFTEEKMPKIVPVFDFYIDKPERS